MNIYVYTLNFILFDHKQNFSVPTQFFKMPLFTNQNSECEQKESMKKDWKGSQLKHTTTSVKHGGGSVTAWAYMDANGFRSPVFTDYVQVGRNTRTDLHGAIISDKY